MEFEVQDMTCGHCASRITKALKEVDESARIKVDLDQKSVNVESTTAPNEFLHAISDAGYTATLKA